MIRVGFIMSFTGSGWVGGLNYYKSLFEALVDAETVQVVLLAGPEVPESILAQFPKFETVRSTVLNPTGRAMTVRKIAERLFGRAFLVERVLRRNRIDVLSHSGHLGPRSRFPTISWIPDFQHQRLPEFFSDAERRSRDGIFRRMARYSSRVIVSSNDAKSDFLASYPDLKSKVEVLHFVPCLQPQPTAELMAEVRQRYNLPDRYFHVPNQLWKHKNHGIIVSALSSIKAANGVATVVSTGSTDDYRHPTYFEELMSLAKSNGVAEDFRFLGLVPEQDMRCIMQGAVAIINPSRFEGWSTTVEEAKAIGKTLLLSDLPVHREQNPPEGLYFSVDDGDQLGELMQQVLHRRKQGGMPKDRLAAAGAKRRRDEFRREYEAIVARTVTHNGQA